MNTIDAWLEALGLGQYADVFAENDIEWPVLPELTHELLREIGVKSVGHRMSILKAIQVLGRENEADLSQTDAAVVPVAATGLAERRQLTVMFIDLVGSTALSGQLDPEDMRELILAYQNTVACEVTRFSGYVAKYMGDGVLSYFGWPQAHENDAERAVRAGLAVTTAVAKLTTARDEPMAARVGIATGPVVVGDLIGQGAAQEEAVVGETPNLAGRLQGLAQPDSVVVSETTRRLLGEAFDLQELGPKTLKGIAEPVSAYSVVGGQFIESRFEAYRGDSTLALVGRDEELALLLRHWQQACQGEGQAALISGEAGIGKSRLLRAVGDALNGQPHYRINYQGSPYHTDSALHPAIQQLTRAAGLAANDSDDTKLDRLGACLGLVLDAPSNSVPLIATLLGIDASQRYDNVDLTSQQERTQTLQALLEYVVGLARHQPVLFVLEDVHWFDPTTLELVELALEAVRLARVLLLITARPTFDHRLGSHPIVTGIVLSRLGRESALDLIEGLTSGKSLPDELLNEIMNKTDGIPLFVEELTKSVLEAGFLHETSAGYVFDGALPSLAIPSSLQDSLMARLDRLPVPKEVAQAGACIGREFSRTLLAAVSPLEDKAFDDALEALTESKLVFRRGGGPSDVTYVFKHALVRDAAYASLLKSRRAFFHARIAESLSELHPEQVAKEPELLAYHYTEAGLTEQALTRWLEAARRASERPAYSEAISQLDRALELLEKTPRGVEWTRCALDIQTLRAAALVATRGFIEPATADAYEKARALCRELGDPPEVYPVLRGLYNVVAYQGNLPAALSVAKECLRLAETGEDCAPKSLAHRLVGMCLFLMGDPTQARVHLENARDQYELRRHQHLAGTYGLDLRAVFKIVWHLILSPSR